MIFVAKIDRDLRNVNSWPGDTVNILNLKGRSICNCLNNRKVHFGSTLSINIRWLGKGETAATYLKIGGFPII